MNPKRIILGLIATFVVITASNNLIHGVLLQNDYEPGMGTIWRSEISMPGIMISNLLVALAFTMLWARISLSGAGIQCAIALGVFMGIANIGYNVMHHAVAPLPEGLLIKWIIFGFIQFVLVGLILFVVNKPTKPAPDISGG